MGKSVGILPKFTKKPSCGSTAPYPPSSDRQQRPNITGPALQHPSAIGSPYAKGSA